MYRVYQKEKRLEILIERKIFNEIQNPLLGFPEQGRFFCKHVVILEKKKKTETKLSWILKVKAQYRKDLKKQKIY